MWLTHGHNYYVSMGNSMLKEEAQARGVDIVMYGHTHKPVIDMERISRRSIPAAFPFPARRAEGPSYIPDGAGIRTGQGPLSSELSVKKPM